jgi:prolipoprotein diacylglyceryltransferase
MLNMGQWLSIPVVIIGLSFIVLASMHKTKHLLPTEQMQENNQTDIL